MRRPSLTALAAIAICIGPIVYEGTAWAQTPAPAAPAKPQDPLNRTSPQSTVLAFLDMCRSKNFERAARYLDLAQVPAAQRSEAGPQIAQQLQLVLDRDADFDVAELSRDPEGDREDGLAPN